MSQTTMLSEPDFSKEGLLSPDIAQNPFPFLKWLRQYNPVHYLQDAHCFVVVRITDIKEIIANTDVFSNDLAEFMGSGPELAKHFSPEPAMFKADPPQHAPTRNTVASAFTALSVKNVEGEIQHIVDAQFDKFIPRGKVEVYEELAFPVPMRVIAGQLGIPQDDLRPFRRWSDAVVGAQMPSMTVDEREKFAPALAELNAYMLDQRRKKRENPTPDLISRLAVDPPPGVHPLTDGEFCSVVQQLLTAGNETTTSTTLGLCHYLASDPELFHRVKQDRGLIRPLIDETLRMHCPVLGVFRAVRQDTEVAGVSIPKGSLVFLSLASANYDEAVFERPEEFDITRRNGSRHMAFGDGIHRCVGQMLARKELECIANTLFDRIDNLTMLESKLRYDTRLTGRMMVSLNLAFTPTDDLRNKANKIE